MANQKFKTKVQADAGVSIPSESASKALTLDSNGDVKSSATTDTELGYLSGVTSSVQTQLTDAQADATQALADAAAAQSDADAAQADATQALSDAADAQADIDAHISDTTGAHAASAIAVTPVGNLVADDVQEALEDHQDAIDAVTTDVADLVTLSGVAANATSLGSFTGNIIPDNQTVKQALQSLETTVEALPDPMEYKGLWDASTNTPTLADGIGDNGDVYQVSVAGTVDFGAGPISFEVGDKAVYNGASGLYEKWDMTDAVISVNGQNGIVVLDSDDVAEGSTNLYFSDERAQDAVGAMVVDTDTINATYTDATPELKFDVKTQMSITSDASGVKLVNDNATPGNTQYYGTDASGVKGFHAIPAVGSPGDIQETSFAAANNVAAAANLTGLAFAAGVVRSFKAQVSIALDATADSFEVFELKGINKGSSFDMSVSSVGDDSGIVFSITSAGQVQYTSPNSAGFVSNTMKFRASTTSV